jgi:hypothetical protein
VSHDGNDSAAAKFDDLVSTFVGVPDVLSPGFSKGFGSSALRVNGKIFAMLVRGRLVVKLSSARVTELVQGGQGTNFDANKGKPLKQWLVVNGYSEQNWEDLSNEALNFVRG